MKTMFLRPDESVLTPNGIAGFQPDFTVINACEIKNDQFEEHGLNSEVFVCLSVEKKLQIIGGTSYCGEMKKGIVSCGITHSLRVLCEPDVVILICCSSR